MHLESVMPHRSILILVESICLYYSMMKDRAMSDSQRLLTLRKQVRCMYRSINLDTFSNVYIPVWCLAIRTINPDIWLVYDRDIMNTYNEDVYG